MADDEMKKLIPRINELAKKAKEDGLSEVEELERKKLRKRYLEKFRESFKSQIEMVRVFDKAGKEVTPKKVQKNSTQEGPA